MKILNTDQIRALDAFTIRNEPISSLDLMERAARAFTNWFCLKYDPSRTVHVFCGKGNNGGDGLAIARLLSIRMYSVKVFIVDYSPQASPEFSANEIRLRNHLTPEIITTPSDIPTPGSDVLVIDALLGSGLSRPVSGLLQAVIEKLNLSGAAIHAVDIASGLRADAPNGPDDTIIKPVYTVSFQLPKPAFVLPRNEVFVGEWHVVDIGLDAGFIEREPAARRLTVRDEIPALTRVRSRFSHKGTFGHAFLAAGSYGKIGAAFLAGKACLRSGAGLLTVHTPSCGYTILQSTLPEAMVHTDLHENHLTTLPSLQPYAAAGIGPGIGTENETVAFLEAFLQHWKGPLVLDADALNILATHPAFLKLLPENTVLTPHPKEFQRLAGPAADDYDMIRLGQEFAARHKAVLCLKGAYTAVILPDGTVFFNTTGNPGMATGGSGDVLTGIITGLLAQGYPPADAARLGVYKHGEAGDNAARRYSQPALIASDLIANLRW